MNSPSSLILGLANLSADDLPRCGGKGVSLGVMAAAGFPVPPGVCIATDAYERFLDHGGVREKLQLLLGRKPLEGMRWEELWDLGLRIRSLFLSTPLPPDLLDDLRPLAKLFPPDRPVCVRSSAPCEDSGAASFAGRHDSFLDVRGFDTIVDAIRMVWGSLWTDRSLLYRKELGLDPSRSSMAVIVQEMVNGERSGVAFGRAPAKPFLMAIEAVWGLNRGLVDGEVEPDRVLIDPHTEETVERHPARRTHACRSTAAGIDLVPLPPRLRHRSPLPDDDVRRVVSLLKRAEELFGTPQDMEWTIRKGNLFVLQSRPITTSSPESGDDRVWYLSLHRSLSTLERLRQTIESEILPAMERTAREMGSVDPATLSDSALEREIARREEIVAHWEAEYRRHCIPMAHGIRLFGELYLRGVKPRDPFSFLDLLAGDRGLLAMERNEALRELALAATTDPDGASPLLQGGTPDPSTPFGQVWKRFIDRFGDVSWVLGVRGRAGLSTLLERFARSTPPTRRPLPPDDDSFLALFPPNERPTVRRALEIGRTAYRLRDNDNLFLGLLTARLEEARREHARRRGASTSPLSTHARIGRRLAPSTPPPDEPGIRGFGRTVRQIVGQPASEGVVSGPARVITTPADLADFREGEILVCDSVDPTMTFIIPLAAGIVERRGGMLVHGAIVAREYRIPCVTGVPRAIELIDNGDMVTVDGFLGIVTVETERRKGGIARRTRTSAKGDRDHDRGRGERP